MSFERALGRLFTSVHAGDRHLAWHAPGMADAPDTIRLTSPAFADGASMPARHAAVGDNVSPPLVWSNVPEAAVELVLIMEDPDAPVPRPPVHLIAFGIAPDRRELPEGALAPGAGQAVNLGRGFFGRIGYAGPRPVAGHGPHRYVFQVFAVSERLTFAAPPDRKAILARIAPCILAKGRLTGTYERI